MIKNGQIVRLRKLEDLVDESILVDIDGLLIDKYNDCVVSKKMLKSFESETRLVQIKEVFDVSTFLSIDNVVFHTDWIENLPLEERRVSLKVDKEKKRFYKVIRYSDVNTITLSNGNTYEADEIDFDTLKFNVGDKVKLMDNVEIDKTYNGITLTKTLRFDIGTVTEVDEDNTVLADVVLKNGDTEGFWYGIDCLEMYVENKEERQEIDDLSKCREMFEELESRPLMFNKETYRYDIEHEDDVYVTIQLNQEKFDVALRRVKEKYGNVIWFESSDKVDGGLALTFEETKKLVKYLTDYVEVMEKALDIEERQF